MKNLFFAVAILCSVAANAQLQLPHSVKVISNESLDWKYGPWSTTTSAKTNVPSGVRVGGLTVYILSCSCEYWWLDTDLTDSGLIVKSSGATGWALTGTTNLTGDATINSGTSTLLFTQDVGGIGAFNESIRLGLVGGVNPGVHLKHSSHSGSYNSYIDMDDNDGLLIKTTGGGGPITIDGSASSSGAVNITGTSNLTGQVNILTKPTRNDAAYQLLARDSTTGRVQFVKKSSISGGGGSTSLGTITADPFNYPASGNTLDVFGGRTRGNLQSVFGDYSLPVITVNNNIVVDGNSNSFGSLLSSTSLRYGDIARGILGTGNYNYSNFAVPGETTQQMTARQSTTLAAFDGAKTHNYMLAFEIENDAFINTSLTASQLYTNMATWYSASKAAGFYTIGMTPPTRAYYGSVSAQQSLDVNKKIEAADSLLQATTTSYDTLIVLNKLPRLSNNLSSVGYFYDFTHFNSSAHADLADRAVSIIRRKLGQQDYTPPRFASWDGNTTDRSMIFGTKNNFPVGFIQNGKVRGEFNQYGTFAITSKVSSGSDGTYKFGVGQNLATSMMIRGGLKAAGNGDIMAGLVIHPSFFDDDGRTGTLHDAFRIHKDLLGGNVAALLRVDSDGKIIHRPNFTASSPTDYALIFGSSITGPASGNYTQNSFSGAFSFAHNGQTHISNDFAPTLTRGAFTNTTEVTLNVNSGSSATGNDKAILVSAVDGEGIHIDHAGGGVGLDVNSTTSSANIFAFNTGTGNAIINFKTTGTAVVQRNITNSSSNASGLVDISSWERGSGSQTAGTGLSQYWSLVSDGSNPRRAVQEDWYWVNNADGLENAGKKWNMFKHGVLTETMRLETDKLSLGTGSPTALLDIKPGGSAAGSAPIKLNYNSITTTGASGTGTVATITFASQPKIPFEVGGTVTISGVTPSGYNGTYTVTAATLIAVSYTNATTGSQTVAGIAETGMLTNHESGAIERDKNDLYFSGASHSRWKLAKQDSLERIINSSSTSSAGSKTITWGDTNINNGSFGSALFGESSEINTGVGSALSVGEGNYIAGYGGVAFGRGTYAGGGESFIGGRYVSATAAKTNTKAPQSTGVCAFGFYITDTNQIANHGSGAVASAILGGRNANIPAGADFSVVLGGDRMKLSSSDTAMVYVPNFRVRSLRGATNIIADASGNLVASKRIAGSFTATGTVTTTFTVTFGNTQAGTSYKVTMSPTSILAVGGYVTNKTTTTFDYVVPAATGTVSLDYEVIP